MSTQAKTQVSATPTPAASKVGGQSLLSSQDTQSETEDSSEECDRVLVSGSSDPPDQQLQRAEQQGHHFQQVEVATYTPATPVQRLVQRDLLDSVKERWEDGAVSLKPQESTPIAAQVSPWKERWEDGAVTLKPESVEAGTPAIQAGQSQADDNGSFEAGSQIESRLQSSRGGGQPLPNATRDFMESRFGNDFSGVRVHTNAESVQMNQSLQAQAFTHGNDIYFNSGKYNPESSRGKRLLAHELTHTIQQTGPSTLSPKRLDRKAGKPNKSPSNATTQRSPDPKVQRQTISQLGSPLVSRSL
ncbi:MAG TPA: DUF4157 domain-containing protein, partial [Trichocoleus sp.]